VLDARVTGDLDAWARAAAKAASDEIEAQVGSRTRRVYTEARAAWPVRRADRPAPHPRGFSRSRLGSEVLDDGDAIRGRIANDSGYAYFIRSKRFDVPDGNTTPAGRDGKRHVWSALVRGPMDRAASDLVAKLRAAIVAAVERVR